MGMWGARSKAHEASTAQSSTLPADRLEQLMTFVERAAVPAPVFVAPDLPPRMVPSRPVVAATIAATTPEPTMAAVEPVPATPVPAPAPVQAVVDHAGRVAYPEPILVQPAPVAGKRRRLLPQSA